MCTVGTPRITSLGLGATSGDCDAGYVHYLMAWEIQVSMCVCVCLSDRREGRNSCGGALCRGNCDRIGSG